MLGCTLLATAIGTAMGVYVPVTNFQGRLVPYVLVAPIGLPKVLLGFCYLSFLDSRLLNLQWTWTLSILLFRRHD